MCVEATLLGVPVLQLERVTLPLHSTHRIDLGSEATDCSHHCYNPAMVEMVAHEIVRTMRDYAASARDARAVAVR